MNCKKFKFKDRCLNDCTGPYPGNFTISVGVTAVYVNPVPPLYQLNDTHCALCHSECGSGCNGPVLSNLFLFISHNWNLFKIIEDDIFQTNSITHPSRKRTNVSVHAEIIVCMKPVWPNVH